MSTEATTQNTLVAYWHLKTESPAKVESTDLTPKDEVAFTPDNRTPVKKADYGKNGKYSGE